MSKKTWILISCLVLSLALGLGGSLAYLTDTDTKVNTFTMGDVEIEVNEDKTVYPGMMPGVMVDKKASITNTGTNDAWVFMTAAVPVEYAEYINFTWRASDEYGAKLFLRNGKPVTDAYNPETDYDRYVVKDGDQKDYEVETYVWGVKLAKNESTENMLLGVTLSEWVNLVDGKYYYMENGQREEVPDLNNLKVIVTGHAIQGDGINDWETAYNNYMGQWSNWTLDYTSGTTPDQPGEGDEGDGNEGGDDDATPVTDLDDLQQKLNDAATADGVVNLKLTGDITLQSSDESIIVPENAEVVLDLNSHTITANGQYAIENNGVLTIKNGKVTGTTGNSVICNQNCLTLDNVVVSRNSFQGAPFIINKKFYDNHQPSLTFTGNPDVNITVYNNNGTITAGNSVVTDGAGDHNYTVTNTSGTWSITPQ